MRVVAADFAAESLERARESLQSNGTGEVETHVVDVGDFNAVKRLLGLAYFWVGSANGVRVQVWATWLLYAVLVDLTDAVAERLGQPFQALSVEMVYRGLYHFTQAYHRGAADEPVSYLAAKAKRLGILKRTRRPARRRQLALATGPDP